ncbi:hypothetical protein ACED29_18815 [Shewanella sp. 5S214]|uniref:hypothetical protein n=1 Tax=Shewanella sp. 5S214 TaxID=3229999 RepID=UPI00352F5877
MNSFFIRPGYKSDHDLIEFSGDHRSDDFPDVFYILKNALKPSIIIMEDYVTDDYVWVFEFESGIFELNDDWGGLFIIPKTNHKKVINQISKTLVSSGSFKDIQVDTSKYT